MATVFSTEFRYKGATYAVLISMRASGADHIVYAQIYDSSLHHLAPDGELHFRMSTGLRKAADPLRIGDPELLRSIREAVLRHTKSSNEVSDPY
jgi:hypothetical protein